MRIKIIFLITGGVALALAGAFGTFHYTRALEVELASVRTSLQSFGEIVEVPVLTRDLRAGTAVPVESLGVMKVPVSYLPDNVLRGVPALEQGEVLITLSDMKAGNVLFDTDLAKSASGATAGLKPIGNGSIFAVVPRNLAEIEDQLAEGTQVDIVWTKDVGSGRSETRLIATGLRVRKPPMAVGSDASGSALEGRLLLDGEFTDAIRAVVSGETGSLSVLLSSGERAITDEFVLVGPTDLEKLPLLIRSGDTPVDTSLIGKVLGDNQNRATCPTAVIRGGTRSLAEVPC